MSQICECGKPAIIWVHVSYEEYIIPGERKTSVNTEALGRGYCEDHKTFAMAKMKELENIGTHFEIKCSGCGNFFNNPDLYYTHKPCKLIEKKDRGKFITK